MITFISQKHIRYDENRNDVVLAFISVAAASELPAANAVVDGKVLHEGSGAWDISTGDKYGRLESGAWVKQPNGFTFDFLEGV